MFKKLVGALVGISLFAAAGMARASLFHEIYFFADTTLTVRSTNLYGVDPVAAIGILSIDELVEEGPLSCSTEGGCAELFNLEIELQQPQPDLAANVNNFNGNTYTAVIQSVTGAQVFSDWSLLIPDMLFTVPTLGSTLPSSLNLSPGAPGLLSQVGPPGLLSQVGPPGF